MPRNPFGGCVANGFFITFSQLAKDRRFKFVNVIQKKYSTS
jgi:hypothetical protein